MALPATSLALQASPETDAPVRGSLVAAVAELSRAAACAERLQHALSPLLRRAGEAAEAAQSLDDLTQHLQGLADFLAVISQDCPPEWRLDLHQAAGRLRLHSQKLRLTSAGGLAVASEPPLAFASGELELW